MTGKRGKVIKDSKVKEISEWFLLERSGIWIAKRLKLDKNQVYKMLKLLREVMSLYIPSVFEGKVEADETYLGGEKKNNSKKQLRKEVKIYGNQKRDITKQPVFGILCWSGKAYTKIVEGIEAKDLIPIITQRIKTGSKVCSDTWRAYT